MQYLRQCSWANRERERGEQAREESCDDVAWGHTENPPTLLFCFPLHLIPLLPLWVLAEQCCVWLNHWSSALETFRIPFHCPRQLGECIKDHGKAFIVNTVGTALYLSDVLCERMALSREVLYHNRSLSVLDPILESAQPSHYFFFFLLQQHCLKYLMCLTNTTLVLRYCIICLVYTWITLFQAGIS